MVFMFGGFAGVVGTDESKGGQDMNAQDGQDNEWLGGPEVWGRLDPGRG